MRADLHLHTTASDGTESPETVVRKAYERGINIIAVTDHDTVKGLDAARRALPRGMALINGIEISSAVRGADGFRCHILGYGIDPDSPYIAEAVTLGIEKRMEKLKRRIEFLASDFGIRLSRAERDLLCSYNAPSRLHLARILVQRGICADTDSAIAEYLNYGQLPDDRIDAELAINAIRKAGGVPIFAHPLGGEGDKHLSSDELSRRVGALAELGVRGLECFYSRYTGAEADMLCREAKKRGLLVSAGSDYHGENKTVALGELSADGRPPERGDITLLDELLK